MAKDEVMHWPVLGWILKKGGIFGVKRGKSDVTAIRTALTYLTRYSSEVPLRPATFG